MSVKNGKDYIYLIWKDPKTRRQYVVGELSKNGQFEFNYGFEVDEAIKKGFKLLISFEDIKRVYKSDILFPVFASRLPDKKRQGIDKILAKYGMEEFEDYKLLKRSGAKLPIDNLEFIDPILLNEEIKEVKRIFYLAGPRYYMGCNGIDCEKSVDFKIGDFLELILEDDNGQDSNAIKILDNNKNHIGYIPRYYSAGIRELLKNGYTYTCSVFEVQKDNKCNECIKIMLHMVK